MVVTAGVVEMSGSDRKRRYRLQPRPFPVGSGEAERLRALAILMMLEEVARAEQGYTPVRPMHTAELVARAKTMGWKCSLQGAARAFRCLARSHPHRWQILQRHREQRLYFAPADGALPERLDVGPIAVAAPVMPRDVLELVLMDAITASHHGTVCLKDVSPEFFKRLGGDKQGAEFARSTLAGLLSRGGHRLIDLGVVDHRRWITTAEHQSRARAYLGARLCLADFARLVSGGALRSALSLDGGAARTRRRQTLEVAWQTLVAASAELRRVGGDQLDMTLTRRLARAETRLRNAMRTVPSDAGASRERSMASPPEPTRWMRAGDIEQLAAALTQPFASKRSARAAMIDVTRKATRVDDFVDGPGGEQRRGLGGRYDAGDVRQRLCEVLAPILFT
jgi:hypothetical protein